MNDKKKILTAITLTMFIFLFLLVLVLVIKFKDFSQTREIAKAHTVASLIEDGLTAHMIGGTMDKRELYLTNAKESSGALKIWLFRTDKVKDMYGNGYGNEKIRDGIDKKVVETGKSQVKIDDKLMKSTLRITIPYIATVEQTPNCLKCHTNAKEGDVLGGISMVFDLSDAKEQSAVTILNIVAIAIVFIFIFLYIANRFLAPYVTILSNIKHSLKKASGGDYTARIDANSSSEVYEVARWLNTLLEKLENTVGAIEKNISLFVADRKKRFSDPLEKSQSVVEDIAMIYRFKKTIEQDKSKQVIYERLVKLFKEQLHIADLSLYEVDIKNNKRVLIYDDTPDKFCDIADSDPALRCRAYRTNSIVISDDFPSVCQSCTTTKEYLCINYPIDENISLVLNIKPKDKEELYANKQAIGYIRNYFESARPVLQSRILTEILQKSNMIDGLTGLYNRKYLDIFMGKKARAYDSFAVAMLDIDFFKKVNDSFGHDVGDKVLKGLSDVFKKHVSNQDIVFRFGGEEFLIFIPNIEIAESLVLSIKNAFESRIFESNGESFTKTLSAGLSFYKDDSEQIWQVIKNADVALYEAKNSGRNRVMLFSEIKK
jgi:diguanylate cyclase (GGDEF)-like protein